MLGSMKIHHVILALLMSMAMMIAIAGPVTAAGCSNPAHQHAISFTSTETMLSAEAPAEQTAVGSGSGNILAVDKAAAKSSSYNKSGTHRALADSGSGYLYKRSHSGTAQHNNRHVLAAAFKHLAPSDAWDDVKR